MVKYYIYHIPNYKWKNGKIGKIGCAKNAEFRVNKQGYKEYETLEIHDCIYEASKREIELQKQYGYPVDKSPYYESCKLFNTIAFESRSKGGKIAGRIAVESGQLKSVASKGGKIGGKKHIESGHWARISKLSAENRKKPIIQYNKSGDFIAEWESATYAAAELKIERTNILACLKCKTKSANGYVWKYKQ